MGNTACLMSAIFYAVYSLYLKVKITKEEEATFNYSYLLGFVGIFNLILILPVLGGLHVANIERFNWPDNKTWGLLALNAFLANFLWDYCYLRSIMLLGPLITNTGLCLSFPISLVVDVLVYKLKFTALYFIGSACVFIAFGVIMFTDSKKPEERSVQGNGKKGERLEESDESK